MTEAAPRRAGEVWNEPDLREFWTGSADQYYTLLKGCYQAIKAADRGAAFLEATRLAGFSESEASRLFGRDPGLPESTERDYLTPWTAARAESRVAWPVSTTTATSDGRARN